MRLLPLVLACFAAFWLAVGAWAQSTSTDVFDRWTGFAATVQDAIDARTSSNNVFEAYRKRVAEFRSDFNTLRSGNTERIAILRQQIEALGDAPAAEDGTTEPVGVASQRAELNTQLSELLAPMQRAEAEYLRADALVTQIDTVLRERDASRLLSIGRSPLIPSSWAQAWSDLRSSARTIWAENAVVRQERTFRDWAETLPITLVLGFFGLLLILRGRMWSMRIVGRLRHFGARGFGIWRFVVSLLRIALPFAGMGLLALAAISTEWFGTRGEELLLTVAVLSGIMLGYRWVADRVFSRDEDEALILLEAPARAAVRFHVSFLTLLLAIGVLLRAVLDAGSPADESAAVWNFPVLLLAAVPLFRIGKLLRGYREAPAEEGTDEGRVSSLRRAVRVLGLGAMLVAVISPVLAAIGYFEAANALFLPYVVTLALLGLVMALQRFSADVYGAITKQGVQARDALVPALVGFVLLILIAPLVALAWGARITDLTEIWAAIGRGFAIGETRISPTNFLTFAIIFTLGYMITRIVQTSMRTNVLPKTRMDIGGQNAVVSGLGYVGIFLAALAAITGAGIDLSSLAIVAGALSVGIGFGLQNIVSNFVSGIILLIERPISEGDWIEVGGQMGYVRHISVRSTRIETFDRTDVIVPNADLVTGTVTNYTRGNTVGRLIVPVGVAYGTDTKRVEKILREIAVEPPMVLASPAANVFFLNFGADALEFEIRVFLRDVNWMMAVKNDINHAIAARFAEEGIEIPFAQRDLWLRNPEVLQSDGKGTS